ncbi:SufE family protein, partial [bacterium]|nr:SufE family protein [bacterium]
MDLDHLFETFEFLDDWEERYRIIIDLGRKLPEMPDELKTDETKVRGCVSQVWMVTKKNDDEPPR